jgi:hypothetical protein
MRVGLRLIGKLLGDLHTRSYSSQRLLWDGNELTAIQEADIRARGSD